MERVLPVKKIPPNNGKLEEENGKLDSLSQAEEGERDDSNSLVDEISDSLSNDGFGVFH